ncbi:polysaccharide biosynthesis protein [Candidatus Woesearchaeota archaeon]|nr:polysaccharide biosynthesis protein [Candidatus Woesearchaeota archaeon]
MFNDKVILISGGTGSWGNELTKQLLEKYNPREIRIYSRGELKQVEMKRKFEHNPKLRFIIGDVRDKQRLNFALAGVDYVFHLAALKHVPVCEEHPWETVMTNVIGTQNLIEAAIANKVEKFIDVSTDKAVDPLNLYGVSKACGEKLTIAANNACTSTRFVCVRGGNVIGTNGSVIPLFVKQIKTNNRITLTDKRMTRFFISLEEAIGLLFRAAEKSVGGEVFVMKMPAMKMTDLAGTMIEELGNEATETAEIGIRPGEKIHEVLVSKYEASRVVEDDNYFIILPMIDIPRTHAHYKDRIKAEINEYTSENTGFMDRELIKQVLRNLGWLEKEVKHDMGRLNNVDPEGMKKLYDKDKWA